jgi:hypothetical protein
MATVIQKTGAIISAFGSQENFNYTLKVLATKGAYTILAEPEPIAPLKNVGGVLVQDFEDANYLLKFKMHQKRQFIAQRVQNSDTTLMDNAYRLILLNNDIEINNSETDLYNYMMDIANTLALVTTEEINAVIPPDETL